MTKASYKIIYDGASRKFYVKKKWRFWWIFYGWSCYTVYGKPCDNGTRQGYCNFDTFEEAYNALHDSFKYDLKLTNQP